jgi:hypothetical protein
VIKRFNKLKLVDEHFDNVCKTIADVLVVVTGRVVL